MTSTGDAAAIHAALIQVVAEWTTADVQAHVAATVGVALDASEVRAVYLLGLAGGTIGAGALGDRAGLSAPTTSKLVSRLVADGVVERARTGRTVAVALTPTGEHAYELLVAAGHRLVAAATAAWEPAEVSRFRADLIRFVASLSETTPSRSRTTD